MPKTQKKSRSHFWPITLVLLLCISFMVLMRSLLVDKNIALFNPKGLIAQQQHDLLVFSIFVLLTVAIPILFVFFSIAWRYRDTNPDASHTPVKSHSKLLIASIWLIPAVLITVLASVMIPATHKLAPQKSIAADTKPMTIQVIAMRWKWVFLYPEQKVATVNYVQIPVDTPVTFELTADDAPMSSFWVPNLGGQLYAMTGHVNPLNLMATELGDYPGSTAEINGKGFAGMKFTTRASSTEDFNLWVDQVRQSPDALDTVTYEKLLKPSENNPVVLYSEYQDRLYEKVVSKYAGHTEGHGGHE